MATKRPATIVLQEFANLSQTPETPELDALIAGPAYHLMDFPDDRADILIPATAYGEKNADAPDTTVLADVVISTLPNNKPGAVLDTASVRVILNKVRVEVVKDTDGAFSLGTTTSGSPEMSITGDSFVTAGVQAGDIAVLTDGAGNTIVRTVRSVTATVLTFTSDVPNGETFTIGATTKFRIERELTDQEIDSSYVTAVASPLSVTIDATVMLPLTTDGTPKKVHYAEEIYLMYRALRQDLAALGTISFPSEIETELGKIDARNPLAVGVNLALANSGGTPIKYFGVTEQTSHGYDLMRETVGARKDLYSIVTLFTDLTTLQALDTENKYLADGEQVLAAGVEQKFRVGMGLPSALLTQSTVVDPTTGDTQQKTATAPAANSTLSFAALSIDLIAANVMPGDKVLITLDTAATPRNTAALTPAYLLVQQVVSKTKMEVRQADGSVIAGGVQSGDFTMVINKPDDTVRLASAAYTAVGTVADDNLYLDLYDPEGTFVDDGVISGDLLEMPLDPNASVFTGADSFVIDTVVSNQRVRIMNNGRNTATAMNELPHGGARTLVGAGNVEIGDASTSLYYRVVRTLDKDSQVTALQAISTGVASKRMIFVWGDLVDVSGLKDGGLPRTDPATPVDAESQPGFYLAAALAGLTSGSPSHQGFTNSTVTGFTKVYHSNGYFSERQLSALSNSGWFVFTQASEGAPIKIMHQLTTDVSAVEFAEFSMVKNLDYVSMAYAEVLDTYIGKWNMNDETINFVNAGLGAVTDQLRLDRKPRIGSRISAGNVTSIAQSTVSKDRLEVYIEATFPAPLNTAALHLVSN